MYGKAMAALIRLGEGMTRLAAGGQALRAVALLPGVTGHYAVKGGGALLLTAASCDLNYNAVRKPSGPASARRQRSASSRSAASASAGSDTAGSSVTVPSYQQAPTVGGGGHDSSCAGQRRLR